MEFVQQNSDILQVILLFCVSGRRREQMTNIEHTPEFIIGSKWVSKCNITEYEGEVLELTSIWDTHILEFNYQYVLEKGEARLLLSPLERLG